MGVSVKGFFDRSRRSIARSIIAITALTFVQSVVAPIVNPIISAPGAHAATLYDNRSTFVQFESWRGGGVNHTPYSNEGTTPISSNASTMNFTQNFGNQTGFLWNTQTYSFSRDFFVSGTYYFGTSDAGADGVYFYMKSLADFPNDGILNSSTGGGNVDTNGQIKVFFDTFDNGATEMDNDHLTISATNTSGTYTSYTTTNGIDGVALIDVNGNADTDIEDNTYLPYSIKWTAANRTLSVYAGASANRLIKSAVISTTEMNATSFSFGWSGWTGGAWNYQSISDVVYHVGPLISGTLTDQTVSIGETVTYSATFSAGSEAVTPSWEYSTDGGTTWISTGVSTTTYAFQATRELTQRRYRYSASSTVNSITFSSSTNNSKLTVNPTYLETDTALTLNGTTQYAKADDSADVDFAANFTFQAWINPSNVTGLRMIANKENSIEFYINNGKYGFSAQDAINQWVYTSNNVTAVANEWHHIAYTKDSSSLNYKFYLDGQLVYEGDADNLEGNTPFNSSLPFTIGGRSGTATPSVFDASFQGQIDHVALYSAVRTQAEIQADMNSYSIAGNANLQFYYDFNETTGTTVYNRKLGATSAADLTLVGSPTFTDVKITDTTTLPAYTIVKFPRTYLNVIGGWRVPSNVTKASAVIIAGGGGGGSRAAGGGGAGGYVYRPLLTLTPGAIETITVGQGGLGALTTTALSLHQGLDGQNTAMGSHTVAIGGGGGGGAGEAGNTYRAGRNGGSGGGASGDAAGNGSSAAYGYGQQNSSKGYGSGNNGGSGVGGTYWNGGGGGGSGGAGSNSSTNSWAAGNGGAGTLDPVGGTNFCLAAGGGGGTIAGGVSAGNGGTCSSGTVTAGSGSVGSVVAGTATANSGSGGGGSGYSGGSDVAGGNGGSGVVMVRWITASKPTFTPPVNAYLNVGMTETFTTNVAIDSATVNLTRTFRWESTTGGAGGTYSVIKQGTGAANAYFSWNPTDTSTSGSNYLYRVIITDSDTAGLFIVDTSTAVYAVINRALVVSGTSGIAKTINVSKSETFTISLGTSTYRTTLTSNNPGISLDTSTATAPVVTIADTMTVGTYYETLTVTDSVSATIVTPLTIVVAAPPNLLNTGEIVSKNLIFNLDAGNSASAIGESGTAISTSKLKDLSGNQKNGSTANTNHGRLCNAPTYTSDNGGALNFSGTNQCIYVPYFGLSLSKSVTIEAWAKVPSTYANSSYIFAQEPTSTTSDISFVLGAQANTNANARFGYRTSGNSVTDFSSGTVTFAANTWMHIVGTYDGANIVLYVNGSVISTTAKSTGLLGTNTNGYFIGAGYNTNTYFNGSIATIRAYTTALTSDEVIQNYNATRSRFQPENLNFITPTQKYGLTTTETYTATSGYGSDAISYATGNKAGLSWSTTGANTVLRLGDSLTATTHYDTVTVTDSLGASTYLPIKMTVAKADTLTISMDTATAVTYSGAPALSYPKPYYKGLAGSDTLTVTTRFSSATYTDTSTVPTNADTYTVTAANPVFTIGDPSNYLAIVYETSTARINQAKQLPLMVNYYGARAGTPFTLQVTGGSGPGSVTETVTAGSTATGCTVNNHVLSNSNSSTDQKYCSIVITKASSTNYFVETLTANIYFMVMENNMPTNQVGSGPTIGLNGLTSFETSTGSQLAITSITLSAGTVTIAGRGFGSSQVTIKFWRNVLAYAVPNSTTQITLPLPGSARSGPVILTVGSSEALWPLFTIA